MTREELHQLGVEIDKNLPMAAQTRVAMAFTEADTGRYSDLDVEIDPECHLPVPFVRGVVEAHAYATEHDHDDLEAARDLAKALISDEFGSTHVDRSFELADQLSKQMDADDVLRGEVAYFVICHLMGPNNIDPQARDYVFRFYDRFAQFVDAIQSDWERQNL